MKHHIDPVAMTSEECRWPFLEIGEEEASGNGVDGHGMYVFISAAFFFPSQIPTLEEIHGMGSLLHMLRLTLRERKYLWAMRKGF
jgi:hypothetical protein